MLEYTIDRSKYKNMHSFIHLCIPSTNIYYISPMCEGSYQVIDSDGKQYRDKFFSTVFYGLELALKSNKKIT